MKKTFPGICQILVVLALVLPLVGLASAAFGKREWLMPLICAGMLCLALVARGYPTLQHWTFLIWICTGITVGMTFPQWFIGVGDFKFTKLFIPILQLIMFCLGTTLSIADFARVLRRPGGVAVGVVCQFTIMPFLGYALAKASGLPLEIAAGIVLVGSVPSGLASTVMVYLARADVALSVTLTAVTSLLAPVITPFMMQWLAGEMIQIDAGKLMWDLTKMTVIPVLAGLAWHHGIRDRAKWLSSVMPAFSMVGIIAMTLLTVAVGRDNLLRIGPTLILICFVHSTGGYLLGYVACRILRLNESTCRTIAFEVGMQNAGLASAVAKTLEKVATLGLAPIVFGPVMNLTASTLANWWRAHPTAQKQEAIILAESKILAEKDL
jgi:BASS family bile acid:Na+ symporter